MATTAAESPDDKPNSPHEMPESAESVTPWVDYAVHQARLVQEDVQRSVDSFAEASRSRLSDLISTSSAHLAMTLDLIQDVKATYTAQEEIAIRKIKEGVNFAASHPLATSGTVAGLGLVLLKKPRSFFYYRTIRLFMSEETMLGRADAKVKELRQSIELLKTESEKLGKRAEMAEEEMLRGRTKLRQAGKQIQTVISSASKIERQVGGLNDILKELPRREASRFRSKVSTLAAEAKREKNALTKEVSKISNYGISV